MPLQNEVQGRERDMMGTNMIWSAWKERARIWSNSEWQSEQHRAASSCWRLLQIPNTMAKCQSGSLVNPQLLPAWSDRGHCSRRGPCRRCSLCRVTGRVQRRRGQCLYTWTGCKWPPSCRSDLFKRAGGEPGRYAVLPFGVFPSGIGREGNSSHRGSPEYIALVYKFRLELKAYFCSNFFHITLINQHKESCKISCILWQLLQRWVRNHALKEPWFLTCLYSLIWAIYFLKSQL